ncbi:MAG TPA: phosphatase, partial [Terrimesophilobacter sp.]|nr:phosphatase [Terrimesophilobacter sp.]
SAAFRDILHPKHGYFVPHYAPNPLHAIELVRAAGGVPVLAHPATRGVDAVVPREHLKQLVDAGLFGLELRHRENKPEGVAILAGYADEFGLAVTGSSDYHGAGKPNRLGENTTERDVLERLVAEATGSKPFFG